jgi:hypothetical protein
MRRRRLLIILSATVVVAPILVYGLRTRLAAAAGSLPELIELAPGNSTFIAYLDLAELRKEPLIEHLAELAAPVTVDRDYAEFVTATGFDYRRDLDQVVIAASTGHTLAVADGRFDQQKIEQYALRSGRLEHDGDRPFYVMKSATPGKNISLTFLGTHRIAIAEGVDIPEHMISPSVPLDPAMRQRLSRVAGAPAFAGFRIPDAVTHARAAAPDVTLLALESLRGIDLAVKPDGNQMLISAEGECENSSQAQQLAEALDLLRSTLPAGLADPKIRGRISAENAALAARLIQAAGISTDGERVRLLLTVTPEMVGSSVPAQ